MRHEQLRRFVALDRESFTQVAKLYGFAALACYRVKDDRLSLVIASDAADGPKWPVVMTFTADYTAGRVENLPGAGPELPIGWTKIDVPTDHRKLWPKNVRFYWPAQDLWYAKFLMVAIDAPGRRRVESELDAGLEVLTRRISFWIDQSELSHFVSEMSFREHMRGIGIDVQKVIDHEIRTPLASISGYVAMLEQEEMAGDKSHSPEVLADFRRVMSVQSAAAIEAVNKLSFSLQSTGVDAREGFATAPVNIGDVAREACRRLRTEATDLLGVEAGQKLRVTLKLLSDDPCIVQGSAEMLGWSIWEVLKNAAIYGRGGDVAVAVYRSDRMIVVDVDDDGPGVSQGAEELVFLRFYQDPNVQSRRRGKRGLGLGLFLARYLTERHFGVLTFVRSKAKGGVFRFIFPVAEASSGSGDESGRVA